MYLFPESSNAKHMAHRPDATHKGGSSIPWDFSRAEPHTAAGCIWLMYWACHHGYKSPSSSSINPHSCWSCCFSMALEPRELTPLAHQPLPLLALCPKSGLLVTPMTQISSSGKEAASSSTVNSLDSRNTKRASSSCKV